MLKFDRLFQIVFIGLLAAELLSFISYLQPGLNQVGFFLLCILAIFLSIKKLEYGVWIVLAELFIGSKGYLFYFSFHNFNLSIRIGLWLIVMAVWFSKLLIKIIKNHNLKSSFSNYKKILVVDNNKYFLALFAFVLFAALNGWLNHNQPANIIDELKRWSYLLLVFPLFTVLKSRVEIEKIFSVFWAAIIWLSLKTIFLLFIFSHGSPDIVTPIYRWIRTTGVGEITQIKGGFYRVFIQSQIYNLFGFIIILSFLLKEFISHRLQALIKIKLFWSYFSLAALFLTTILLSFSRSFWVGLAGGLLLIALMFFSNVKKISSNDYKAITAKLAQSLLILGLIFSSGLLLIFLTVKFPYPKPIGGFDTTNLFSERATVADESAIGSRWSLLPKLWQKIATSPILGKGFGTTVTYKSNDPRVLAINPSGEYTTYSFEWAWLGLWLNLGLLGVLSYLVLLAKLIRQAYKNAILGRQTEINLALAVCIISLMIVNIFTPYLNHPLGLGFLLLASAIVTITTKPIAEI